MLIEKFQLFSSLRLNAFIVGYVNGELSKHGCEKRKFGSTDDSTDLFDLNDYSSEEDSDYEVRRVHFWC